MCKSGLPFAMLALKSVGVQAKPQYIYAKELALVIYEPTQHKRIMRPLSGKSFTILPVEFMSYSFGEQLYPTLVSEYSKSLWLVLLDGEGRMETAFIVEEPNHILQTTVLRFWASLRS